MVANGRMVDATNPMLLSPLVAGSGGAVKNLTMRFLKDESGATAIEYGLIAAGIAVAIITIVKGVGNKLTTIFTKVSNALN